MEKRILIVDDHPLMRRGVKQLIDMQTDLITVGEAASGEEAIDIFPKLQPDLILLDLNMKNMSGIETLEIIKRMGFNGFVLIVTVSDDDKDVVRAIRAGADGYVLKDAEPEELIKAIRSVANEQLVVSPVLSKALARELQNDSPDSASVAEQLTDRESEILRLITKGLANKHIANTLFITESTVKVHVKNLLKKLKLRSRVEAAIWGVGNGYDK